MIISFNEYMRAKNPQGYIDSKQYLYPPAPPLHMRSSKESIATWERLQFLKAKLK